jgi:DNA-binding MarR family transcriptional regulator
MRIARKGGATEESKTKLSVGNQSGSFGYQLIEVYNTYVKFLEARTASKMISLNLTQWRTLTRIRFNADQTQKVLADAVGIDPSSMTPIIDLFEKRGWVTRNESRGNRSAYSIRMTRAGTRAYSLLEGDIEDAERLIGQLLGAAEHEAGSRMLAHLHSRLGEKLRGATAQTPRKPRASLDARTSKRRT